MPWSKTVALEAHCECAGAGMLPESRGSMLMPGVSSPIVPGHEMVGTIAAVGPREKKWKVGDRVGGAWHGGHDGIDSLTTRKERQQLTTIIRDLQGLQSRLIPDVRK